MNLLIYLWSFIFLFSSSHGFSKKILKRTRYELKFSKLVQQKKYKKITSIFFHLSKKTRSNKRLIYLTALSFYRSSQYKNALVLFKKLENQYILKNYVNYYEGVSFFKLNDYNSAIKQLKKVGQCKLQYFALSYLLLAYREQGNNREIVKILKKYKKGALKGTPELYYYSYLTQNKKPALKALLYNSSKFSREILTMLKQKTTKDKEIKELTDFAETASLYFAHNSIKAETKLKKFIKVYGNNSIFYCQSVFYLQGALMKQKKYSSAAKIVKIAQKKCNKSSVYIKLLFKGAKSLWRAGKLTEARKMYKQIVKLYPAHSYCDDAMLYVAMTWKDQNKQSQYLKALQLTASKYQNGDRLPEVLWWIAWYWYSHKKWEKALSAMQKGYERFNTPNFLYWIARIYEKKKQRKKAFSTFAKLFKKYPLTYYAHLVFARIHRYYHRKQLKILIKIAHVKQKSNFFIKAELQKQSKNNNFRRFVEFALLGLPQFAQAEFLPLNENERFIKAYILDKLGYFNYSHQLMRASALSYKKQYPLKNNNIAWKIAYPPAHLQYVKKIARKLRIKWEFIISIMREESGFNEKIKSYASAYGLMQLIFPTARMIARKKRLKKPTKKRLFTATYNIKYGSALLDYLYKKYGNVMLVMAAYNAGEAAVNRWLSKKTSHFEIDEFVENIPYKQTRNYVKRVSSTYGAYRFLYSRGKHYILFDTTYHKKKR